MNLFVLSELSPKKKHVGWSVSYSFESTLNEVFQPTFIYADRTCSLNPPEEVYIEKIDQVIKPLHLLGHRFKQLTKSWYKVEALPSLKPGTNVLLVVGLTPNFLLSLYAIKPILPQFDLKIAYLLDGFDQNWLSPPITDLIANQLDHLFVISHELAAQVKQAGSVQTSFLPLAIDTTKTRLSTAPRWIDVISYGRRNEAVHQVLQRHYNQQDPNRLYHHSTVTQPIIEDFQEHSLLLRKLLNRSKISLCFEASGLPRFRGHSPILYRWFEAWSSGCTVVGKRPFGTDIAELMDWENSTIDIPDDPDVWIDFFELLLNDEAILALNSKRNQQQCMLRHDWRYRIKDILDTVGLSVPDSLANAIEQLQTQANNIEVNISAGISSNSNNENRLQITQSTESTLLAP